MKKFALLLLLLTLAAGLPAWAHAFLDHADPRVGSTIKASPRMVRIWFTEELEPAFSKIRVFDAGNKEIDARDVKVGPSDRTLMTVTIPPLTPGKYRVMWDAVATDTHHTSGSFEFTMQP